MFYNQPAFRWDIKVTDGSYSTEFSSAYIINVNKYIMITVVVEIDMGYYCVEDNEIVAPDHWLSLKINFKFNDVY